MSQHPKKLIPVLNKKLYEKVNPIMMRRGGGGGLGGGGGGDGGGGCKLQRGVLKFEGEGFGVKTNFLF